MKKHLFLVLRFLLAAAGIAFIALSLTWRDSVVLPAGWDVAGAPLAEATHAEVVKEDIAPTGRPQGMLELDVPLEGDRVERVTLDAAALDADPAGPQFRPGIVTTLRTADFRLLALGLLLTGIIFPIQGWRWLILLKCRGLDVGWWKSFKLTMIGQFFNFCMPGTTGGDVIKAYYAAKRAENRGAAVMSVFYDRVTGLFGLVVLAGVVGLFQLGDPLIFRLTLGVWIGMLGAIAVAAVYFSKHIRKVLQLDRLIAMLPGNIFTKIDQAALAYGDHRAAVLWATAVSVPVHFLLAAATVLAGIALGVDREHASEMLVIVPLLILAAAVPLSYQGIGIMEGIAYAMMVKTGMATMNQVVGMLLMWRIYLVAWSLLGAAMLLRGDVHLFPERDEAEDDEPTIAPAAPL